MRDSAYWSIRKKYPLKMTLYFGVIYSPILILGLIAAPHSKKLKLLVFFSLVSVSIYLILKGWCTILRKEAIENYRILKKINPEQIQSTEIVHVKKMIFRFLPTPTRSAQKKNSKIRISVEYGLLLDKEFSAYLVPNPRLSLFSKFNLLKRLTNPSYFIVPCDKIIINAQRKTA